MTVDGIERTQSGVGEFRRRFRTCKVHPQHADVDRADRKQGDLRDPHVEIVRRIVREMPGRTRVRVRYSAALASC
jgi:hypothetical protein